MEIPIPIQLSKIDVQVTAVRDNKPLKDIVGFFELIFFDGDNKPLIKVRGCTVKVKQFKETDGPVFTINAPAYRSSLKYRTSFFLENLSLWHDIEKIVLEELSQQTGGLTPKDYVIEDVNSRDIPF